MINGNKVKVKLSQSLNNIHVMKIRRHLLASALDRGEQLALRSSSFTPWKEPPRINWLWSLVDARAGMDLMATRKIPMSAWNRITAVESVDQSLHLATTTQKHHDKPLKQAHCADWLYTPPSH
jgi:hypothetical protein